MNKLNKTIFATFTALAISSSAIAQIDINQLNKPLQDCKVESSAFFKKDNKAYSSANLINEEITQQSKSKYYIIWTGKEKQNIGFIVKDIDDGRIVNRYDISDSTCKKDDFVAVMRFVVEDLSNNKNILQDVSYYTINNNEICMNINDELKCKAY